jgi:hypothetical protein
MKKRDLSTMIKDEYVLKEKQIDKKEFLDILSSNQKEYKFLYEKDVLTNRENKSPLIYNASNKIRNPINPLMDEVLSVLSKDEIKNTSKEKTPRKSLKLKKIKINDNNFHLRSNCDNLEEYYYSKEDKFKTDMIWNPRSFLNSELSKAFNFTNYKKFNNGCFIIEKCFKLLNNILNQELHLKKRFEFETKSIDRKKIKNMNNNKNIPKYFISSRENNNLLKKLVNFKEGLFSNINGMCLLNNYSQGNLNINSKIYTALFHDRQVDTKQTNIFNESIYSDKLSVDKKLYLFVKRLRKNYKLNKYNLNTNFKKFVNLYYNKIRSNIKIMDNLDFDIVSNKDQDIMKEKFKTISFKSEKNSFSNIYENTEGVYKIKKSSNNLKRKRQRSKKLKKNKKSSLYEKLRDNDFPKTKEQFHLKNNLKIRIDMGFLKYDQDSIIKEPLEKINKLSSTINFEIEKVSYDKLMTTESDESHHNGLYRVLQNTDPKNNSSKVTPLVTINHKKNKKIFEIKKDKKNKKFQKLYNGKIKNEEWQLKRDLQVKNNFQQHNLYQNSISLRDEEKNSADIDTKKFYPKKLKIFQNVSFELIGSMK